MNKQFGFSKVLNEAIFIYEISNKINTKVTVLSLGAAVQSINLPWQGKDKSHESVNVVLGFSNVEDYETNDCYIGVAVGRVAGRISNGKFNIEERSFHLTKNNGGNCLHGGRLGISRKNWKLLVHTSNSVSLHCKSLDNEDGFPGDMEITIKYTINDDNSLVIEYDGFVEKHSCPINLTNHSYFNLSGISNVGRGIKDHVIQIKSSRTLELNKDLLPNGNIIPLSEELDLKNNTKPLDGLLLRVGDDPKGFDNYYIFDQVGIEHCQAVVSDGITRMSIFTDQNGVQFYTSNFFKDVQCSHKFVHQQYGALCLEAQNYPDAINHKNFPSILLKPGQKYYHKTIYKFEKI